ncbi:unnamed protein product [Choristocarpus tenellus]
MFCPLTPFSICRLAYDRLVTDFETLECVRSRRKGIEAEQTDENNYLEAETKVVVEAVERYLESKPASGQTRESVRKCVKILLDHPKFMSLTAPERLQMINHQPEHAVEIHLMIEDCHRRFGEDEVVEELMGVLKATVRSHMQNQCSHLEFFYYTSLTTKAIWTGVMNRFHTSLHYQ